MLNNDGTPARVRWARLRFQIIGPLLASPPEAGELAARLDELSALTYVHPTTGARVHFARPTIERWYYTAKNEPKDPLRVLERKVHARGVLLAVLLPLDKAKNADGRRRVLDPEPEVVAEPALSGIAPLLRELMSEYAATGLPPAYVPLPSKTEHINDDEETDT